MRRSAAIWLLGSWDRIPWWRGYFCLVSVLSNVNRSLTTGWAQWGFLQSEFYLCVCVSNCVWPKNLETTQTWPDFGCSWTERTVNYELKLWWLLIRFIWMVVTAKCSQCHFISEKYRTVQSFKLHFLQNNPILQLYTFASHCKELELFLEAILWKPFHLF